MTTKRYTDSKGRIHEEDYDKKGNLKASTIMYTDSQGIAHDEWYDKKGHLTDSYLNYVDDEGKECRDHLDGNNNLIDRHVRYTDDDGVEHNEDYGKDGKLTGEWRAYPPNENMVRIETYDGKGKLLERKDMHHNSKNITTEIYDGKGKLLNKEVDIDTGDKWVNIEYNRSWWDKFLGHHLGRKRVDRKGNVIVYQAHSAREEVNSKLKKILQDRSLSGAEKRQRRREVAAEYRETSGYKAPNKKIGAVLKKYRSVQEER